MASSSTRARVMARSRQLGHCICDPRKPCPCDLLLEQDVCTCAGERLDRPAAGAVALTRLVRSAGCASKLAPADLARVLSRLPPVADPRLLVGAATADDAGVFQLAPDLCLVQTVDVFAPCVDDPYLFGRIAACNSLSDIYAMGATPLTALSVIGYPIGSLGDEPMSQMLRGGMDALAQAGVVLVGGHSIDEDEIKFGFAVTGVSAPGRVITNAGARPGDALVLTKPIGTGIICLAAQLGRTSAQALETAAASMAALNRGACEVMLRASAHACTDVTGFGLLGHLAQMARESAVRVELWWEAVPLLPDVRRCAEAGMVPGAAERNREFAADMVTVHDTPEWAADILHDPQTSGGLLMAVAPEAASPTIADLRAAGCADAAVIGRVVAEAKGEIVVKPKDDSARAGDDTASAPDLCPSHAPPPAEPEECCAPGAGDAGSPREAFQRFMAAATGPGALDVVQKELMTIALSVAVQCAPCLRLHLAKARGMGITDVEIEEAAWLGVAFGGCKAMMFWQEQSRA